MESADRRSIDGRGLKTHAQRDRSIYGRGLGAESDETRFSADLRTTRSLLLVGLDRRASRGSPTTRYAGRRARRSRPTTDLPGRAGCPEPAVRTENISLDLGKQDRHLACLRYHAQAGRLRYEDRQAGRLSY